LKFIPLFVLLLPSMRSSLILFSFSLFVLLFSACSDYNKVVKSDNYDEKLKVANEYFDKGSEPQIGKFSKKPKTNRATGAYKLNDNYLLHSVTLYEQIYQRMPKTGEGELAYFRIGKAYYLSGDYYMAGYYLGSFAQRYPVSVKAQEAMFLSAMCSVNNSPEFTLDQNETDLAINNLQQFIDKYPQSELVDSCNHIMDRLRLKLEKKDFETVKLYDKTENYRSAVTSAMTFMEDHPRSKNKEIVYYLLVKNSYLLSKYSIDTKKKERIEQTIERYHNFVSEFPGSIYEKELSDDNELMKKELENINSGK
jgi:outer membrane protein assembly factor BamD